MTWFSIWKFKKILTWGHPLGSPPPNGQTPPTSLTVPHFFSKGGNTSATQRQSVREHSRCLAPPHGMHCRLNCGNGTWVWQFFVKNWKLCCSNQCEIDSGINLSKFFFIFLLFQPNLLFLISFLFVILWCSLLTAVLRDFFTREHANTCNNKVVNITTNLLLSYSRYDMSCTLCSQYQ